MVKVSLNRNGSNPSLTLPQERLSFQRVIDCSICRVSGTLPLLNQFKGQACHHLSVLWCNNLKSENSPRTKSGTESGRHVQLQLMDGFPSTLPVSLVDGFTRPAWGYLGFLEKLTMETERGIRYMESR